MKTYFKTASNEKEASCWGLLFLTASSNAFSAEKSNKKSTQELPITVLCTKRPKCFLTWCISDRLCRQTALLLHDCLGTSPAPRKPCFPQPFSASQSTTSDNGSYQSCVVAHLLPLQRRQKRPRKPQREAALCKAKMQSFILSRERGDKGKHKGWASLQERESKNSPHFLLSENSHICIKTLILKRTQGSTQPILLPVYGSLVSPKFHSKKGCWSVKELPEVRVEFDWGLPPDSPFEEHSWKTPTWQVICNSEWSDVTWQLFSFPRCTCVRQAW